MMGFADFPVEILRALRTKPADDKNNTDGSYYVLLLSQPVRMLIEFPLSYSHISWRKDTAY